MPNDPIIKKYHPPLPSRHVFASCCVLLAASLSLVGPALFGWLLHRCSVSHCLIQLRRHVPSCCILLSPLISSSLRVFASCRLVHLLSSPLLSSYCCIASLCLSLRPLCLVGCCIIVSHRCVPSRHCVWSLCLVIVMSCHLVIASHLDIAWRWRWCHHWCSFAAIAAADAIVASSFYAAAATFNGCPTPPKMTEPRRPIFQCHRRITIFDCCVLIHSKK